MAFEKNEAFKQSVNGLECIVILHAFFLMCKILLSAFVYYVT